VLVGVICEFRNRAEISKTEKPSEKNDDESEKMENEGKGIEEEAERKEKEDVTNEEIKEDREVEKYFGFPSQLTQPLPTLYPLSHLKEEVEEKQQDVERCVGRIRELEDRSTDVITSGFFN